MRRLAFLLALSLAGCGTKASSTTGHDGGAAATGATTGNGGAAATGATTGTATGPGTTGATGPGATTGTSTGSGTPDSVTLLVEPGAGITPLVNAIKGAKTSVHMTMYLLTSDTVINALISQKQAGKEVKVVLNAQFPTGGNQNSQVYTQLLNAGVSVVYAPSQFTYTHEKCVVIDKKEAWIMTMNATNSSPGNREYLAIDDNAADVAEAEAIFEADYAHTAITPTGDLVVAPNNAEQAVLALVNSAQQSILIEGEEFSDSYITNAAAAKASAGIPVHVVLSNLTPTAAGMTTISTLKSHGAKVVVVANPYIHAKAVVVDGKNAYVGSANLTYNSLSSNRELGIITSIASVVSTLNTTISGDFAAGTPQ